MMLPPGSNVSNVSNVSMSAASPDVSDITDITDINIERVYELKYVLARELKAELKMGIQKNISISPFIETSETSETSVMSGMPAGSDDRAGEM